jgi:sigma-B regulation protein RsbU (phosphoserine phosphatase)
VVLALGDVSDKGAGAALMMARTHSMFRGLSMRPDADALFRDPSVAVGLVNAALAKANESCMSVTFLLATFDPSNGEFRYVRAGHVPLFVRRENGKVERTAHQGGLGGADCQGSDRVGALFPGRAHQWFAFLRRRSLT